MVEVCVAVLVAFCIFLFRLPWVITPFRKLRSELIKEIKKLDDKYSAKAAQDKQHKLFMMYCIKQQTMLIKELKRQLAEYENSRT